MSSMFCHSPRGQTYELERKNSAPKLSAMNLGIAFQPGGQPLSGFYASVLYQRSRNQRLLVGILQIIVGILIIMTEIALQIFKYTTNQLGSGFWCGPFVVGSGAYGVHAHLTQTSKSKLNSYIATVLSICPFSVLIILIGALAIYQDTMDEWYNWGILVNGLKIVEGLFSMLCGGIIISRIGRKKDMRLIADYREKLAAKTIEAAEIVSDTLRRERKITVGTVASRNSVNSLCDDHHFPISAKDFQQSRIEENLKMEIFQSKLPDSPSTISKSSGVDISLKVNVEVEKLANEEIMSEKDNGD